MRAYDQKLSEELRAACPTINVRGVETVVKPVPDPEGEDRLDPRMRRDAEARMHSGEKPDCALTEPEQRARMGGPNYNLNQTEIWTKYVEVDTSCGRVPVWVYYPRGIEGLRPALLYVHGGAFKGGSPFEVENACRLVAERGQCVVFNIDYALPPEHPYPIPVTQVYEVLAYVANNAFAYHVDANRIVMGGDSAGGNLTACCAVIDAERNTRYMRSQVLIYAKLIFDNARVPGYRRDLRQFALCKEQEAFLPMVTGIGSDEANAGDEWVYVQGTADCMHPHISPVTFPNKAILPPALLLLAEYDGLRLEGEYYASQLQEAGVRVRQVRYRGMCHGFFDRLGICPQAEDAVDEIVAWMGAVPGGARA